MSNNNLNKGKPAGTYAVTTVYSMPWLSKKSRGKKPNPSKTKKKKTINKLFEKCAEYTDDPFWTSIMIECSKGKFPRGFYYSNGVITYRKGTKTDRCVIEDDTDLNEVYQTIKTFFREKVGLVSKTDRLQIRKAEEEKLAERINTDFQWKNIKTERIKDLLISEFVGDLSDSLCYNDEEKDKLYTTVKLGFMLKCFGDDDIEMDNGKIINIYGIMVDEETDTYIIDPRYFKSCSRNKQEGIGLSVDKNKPNISFMKMWTKYLQTLDKKVEVSSSTESSKSSKSKELKSSDTFSGTLSTFSTTSYDSEDV